MAAPARSILRIGIEGSEAVHGRRATGRYTREIVRGLAHRAPAEGIEVAVLVYGRGARQGASDLLSGLGGGEARARVLPIPGRAVHAVWDRFDAPAVEWILGPLDIFHAATFLTPPVRPGAVSLSTLHSAVVIARPDLLPRPYVEDFLRRWSNYARRADWIIAVSETSRRDLLERFAFPPERVRAIPLGVSGEFRPIPEDLRRLRLETLFGMRGVRTPYILYAGGLQRVKNTAGLIRAFARIVRNVPHRLVLAGEMGDGTEEMQEALRDPALEGRVILTGHLSQGGDALPVLYGAADLYVQPSFYEGWASPPLEAMACGTPVVASTAASLLESCGGAALHAEAGDPEALAHAMERVLVDGSLRADLIGRGRQWSGQWTWDRAVRSTLALYREAAAAGPRPAPRELVPRKRG